jgi:hypothetical protein
MHEHDRNFDGAARMAELTEIVIDQIRKLAALRDEGILTEEEFSAKKTELLSRF